MCHAIKYTVSGGYWLCKFEVVFTIILL